MANSYSLNNRITRLEKKGGSGEITPQSILEVSEGSDFISVDKNEEGDKVKYELDFTNIDKSTDDNLTDDDEHLATSGAIQKQLDKKFDEVEKGLSKDGTKIGHTNSITTQTSAKIYKSTLDSEGHHNGTQTGYDVTTSISSTSTNTQLSTSKSVYDYAEPKQTDSGWLTLTLETEWSGNVYYRKIGKIVDVSGKINKSTASTGWSLVATIPSGYLPKDQIDGLDGTTAENLVRYQINADGKIYVKDPTTSNTQIHFTFIVA